MPSKGYVNLEMSWAIWNHKSEITKDAQLHAPKPPVIHLKSHEATGFANQELTSHNTVV